MNFISAQWTVLFPKNRSLEEIRRAVVYLENISDLKGMVPENVKTLADQEMAARSMRQSLRYNENIKEQARFVRERM